jgi:hypothetical protein
MQDVIADLILEQMTRLAEFTQAIKLHKVTGLETRVV